MNVSYNECILNGQFISCKTFAGFFFQNLRLRYLLIRQSDKMPYESVTFFLLQLRNFVTDQVGWGQ